MLPENPAVDVNVCDLPCVINYANPAFESLTDIDHLWIVGFVFLDFDLSAPSVPPLVFGQPRISIPFASAATSGPSAPGVSAGRLSQRAVDDYSPSATARRPGLRHCG